MKTYLIDYTDGTQELKSLAHDEFWAIYGNEEIRSIQEVECFVEG